jgi:hypothetical protein
MKQIAILFLLFVFISCKKTEHKPTPSNQEKDFSPLTAIVQSNLPQLGGDAGLLIIDQTGKIL